ncbi:F0F1 ATP synthase subunit gamma [Candidatus Daviesbacteria bacterium]|nr:F0F1 ATP synthase subunit gamma [Candidatus Daviesbacteria bacterium]
MTIKEVDQLIEEGYSFKMVAQAYSEIANQKIKLLRVNLERNREFFQEISQVFSLIRALALKRNISISKPTQTLSIIITSNYRFYGDINSDLIDYYIEKTKELKTDRIIIGKTAQAYFRKSKDFGSLQEVILAKDQPNASELTALVASLKNYNQVLIFFSKLRTLLIQDPTYTDIAKVAQIPASSKEEEKIKFIFEPELSKVLDFFDNQILTLLLEETFLESEVSRTASRFISMDQAETEANKFIKESQKIKAYLKRSLINNQILENYAGSLSSRKGGMQ